MKNKGFTLVETLVALVIFVMVISIVTMTGGVVLKVYREIMFQSDSSQMISTVNSSLRDILRYAEDISTDGDGNVVSFSSTETYMVTEADGTEKEVYKYGIKNGTVCVSENTIYFKNIDGESVVLTGTGMYNSMIVEDLVIKYDDSTGVFTFEYVVYDKPKELKKETGEIKVATLCRE